MDIQKRKSRTFSLVAVGLSILIVLALLVGTLPQASLAANPTATSTKKATSSASNSRTATPTPKTAKKTSTKPQMNAVMSVADVTVEVANFPRTTVYYVRATEGNFRGNIWYRLGRIRTNKNGAAKATFRIPFKMGEAAQINVCVKNVYTDATLCQTAIR